MRSAPISFGLVLAITAASAGCYDPNKITAPDEVFTLTASPGVIPANGAATSQITAHVSPASRRTLTFSFTTSDTTITIPNGQNRAADSNGDVTVLLTSGTTPKTVLVTAEAKDGTTGVASRSVPVVLEAASASSIITLSASSSQVEADGVSSVLMRAEINPAITPRNVEFKTTNGSFNRTGTPSLSTNQTAGADGIAVVPLYAATSLGSAVVTAIINGFSATQTVTFVTAPPDFISLSGNPLTISKANDTNSTTMTAILTRSVGAVTNNIRVEFSIVHDATGQASFGRFESTTRNSADGALTVTTKYFPSTAAPLGLSTITARVIDNGLSARVKVNITQ